MRCVKRVLRIVYCSKHTKLISGYNWKKVSQQVRGKVQTKTKTVLVPAGTSLLVRQVVGYCGRSKVMTEAFQTSHILSQEFQNCTAKEELELLIRCDARYDEVN